MKYVMLCLKRGMAWVRLGASCLRLATSICLGINVLSASTYSVAQEHITAESKVPPIMGIDSPKEANDEKRRVQRAIEEVIVTAQKRAESIQDVPLSISVISDSFVEKQSITDFRDVSLYVPGVSINNTAGNFIDIRIRGFGSPISNKAFEQSVGLVVDGIPFARREYWLGSIFDIDRVEVLRGPQGTLFGKNTTGGLFNVTTKKPSDEFIGYLSYGNGELNNRSVKFGIGGPIIQGVLNFRIATIEESRDGFMSNTTSSAPRFSEKPPHESMNGRDREAFRLQLGSHNIFGVDFNLSYENADYSTNGTGWEFDRVKPEHIEFFRYWDPNVDLAPKNYRGSINSRDSQSAKIETVILSTGYDLGEWRFDLILGHSELQAAFHLDTDFTPAPATDPNTDQDTTTTRSGEFRLTSPPFEGLFRLPFGVSSDFILGVFLDDQRIDDSALGFAINVPVIAQFVAADQGGGAVTPLESPLTTGTLGVLENVLGSEVPLVCSTPSCSDQTDVITAFFYQKSQSESIFNQLRWDITGAWTVELGMRYTRQTKSSRLRTECTKSSTGCEFSGSLLDANFNLDLKQEKTEKAFTPKIAIKYSPIDNITLFASWGEGFKSGGFNATTFNTNNPTEYDPEEAEAVEFGIKSTLFNSALNMNLTIFRQEVTDLQSFVVTSDAQLFVANAGEALSEGWEADFNYRPNDWFSLRGTFGYIETEYLEFPNGTCSFDSGNAVEGFLNPQPGCDLTGRPFEFTPKRTGTLSPALTFQLVGPLEFSIGVTAEYSDKYFAYQSLDSRTEASSFVRYSAYIVLSDVKRRLSLQISGENLSDEYVPIHVRDVSLVGGTFAALPDPPRLIHATLRWAF